MANTIKISKSKNLIFKKLSFLYLVFILFLFLSSPGQFVEHYQNLVPGQQSLVAHLEERLNDFEPTEASQSQLKELSIATLAQIKALEQDYVAYRQQNHISGEKLKENHFANDEVLKGPKGERLQGLLRDFVVQFRSLGGKDLEKKLMKPLDFGDQAQAALPFFFQDTPNGVVQSIFLHFQSIILINTLNRLEGEEVSLKNPEVQPIGNLDLIQNFKKVLAPGEKLLFKVKAEEAEENALQVWINQEELNPVSADSIYAYYEYTPLMTGHYSVDILYSKSHYYHNFVVNKAGFKFEQDRSSFLAQVGEEHVITLNPSYLPKEGLSFSSEHADVKFEANQLRITPFHPGAFTVYLNEEGAIVDSLNLYAKDVGIIDVALMDIAGNQDVSDDAIRLEAVNPFWQVVNFNLNITYPNGRQKVLHNATRFLRPDLKEYIQSAPAGSLLAFEEIKVIGKNGETYRDGRTLIKRK